MKLPRRILFVGAHCDDVELLAGGLLAHASFSGRSVGVLVFSDHRGVLDAASATLARDELAENLRWLSEESGNAVVDHTDLLLAACDGSFQRERARLYSVLERLRDQYDLVITHPAEDTNQDHAQVAAEALRVMKAHVTVLSGEFPNNDVGLSAPRVYVPLSERELAAKVRMVKAYRSQDLGGRPYLEPTVVEALARLRGSQIRRPAAEAFSLLGRMMVTTGEGE
jgi:LmbE family N-acetylglucosaminyl deacetylase